MYLSVNQNHIGINSVDYTDGFKPTNKAILSEQGTATNISDVDDSYFEDFETIYTYEGDDTFYIAGSTGDLTNIYAGQDNDKYHFDSSANLTNNFYAEGNGGDDEFTISGDFGNNTLYLYGGNGSDQFKINSALTSNVCIDSGDSDASNLDLLTFETAFSNTGLLIKDFETGEDIFDFSSSAFSGNAGHTLVFGQVNGTEFMPDSSNTYINGNPHSTIHAFDELNTAVANLLNISNDHWYYDTTDGQLYYDQDADQSMEDAVKIAKVTDISENPLDKTELLSSDIQYDYNSNTI